LKEINDTQKEILEQLQKTPFRRFMDWFLTPFRYAFNFSRTHRDTSLLPTEVGESTTILAGPLVSKDEVGLLIDKWVDISISSIQGGNKPKKKQIMGPDRTEIESFAGSDCPTCGTTMILPKKLGRVPKKGESPDNDSLSVEHIVPRILGGNNIRSNLVAMCHLCNMCRNVTMTKLIPHFSTMRKRTISVDEISLVSRFVEWSIRTIHTPNFLNIDSECSEIFARSVAKQLSEPLDTHIEMPTSKSIIEPELQLQPDFSDEDFTELISKLLTNEGEISIMLLGNKLRNYQESNNWDEVGTGALLTRCGRGKNSGLKNAIKDIMPDKVVFSGQHPMKLIRLK